MGLAGLFQGIHKAFVNGNVHTKMLRMLFLFLRSVSEEHKKATMRLVEMRNHVERIVRHMGKEGPDRDGLLLELLLMLVEDPCTSKSMCHPRVAYQLAKGGARWLSQVRKMVVPGLETCAY
jgi:hypothetical protein